MKYSVLMLISVSLFSTARGEVLTQSFVIRLNEMAQIIEEQRQTIQQASLKAIVEEQRELIENLTTIIANQEKNLTRVTEEHAGLIANHATLNRVMEGQRESIENQNKTIQSLTDVIANHEKNLTQAIEDHAAHIENQENQTKLIEEQKEMLEQLDTRIKNQTTTIQSLTGVIQNLNTIFADKELYLNRVLADHADTIGVHTKRIEEQNQILERLDTSTCFHSSLKTILFYGYQQCNRCVRCRVGCLIDIVVTNVLCHFRSKSKMFM